MNSTDAAKLKEMMTPLQMDGGVYDNLYQLVVNGPREAGEIPSKVHMQELVQNAWVSFDDDADKCWTITEAGLQAFMEAYSKIPNPHHKVFGAIRIGFAERCGDGELDGTPVHTLGGCLEWAREHILQTKVMDWSEHFGAYDYATFDFVHPLTKIKTHLKPGDWVILSEDHNHTVHKLSEDN